MNLSESNREAENAGTDGILGIRKRIDTAIIVVGSVVIFLLLGYFTTEFVNYLSSPQVNSGNGGAVQQRVIVDNYPNCHRPKSSYRFEAGPPLQETNPNGECSALWWPPPGRCIMQLGRWSKQPEGPFGSCPESKGWKGPKDVVKMWAYGEAFEGDLKLSPPVYN